MTPATVSKLRRALNAARAELAAIERLLIAAELKTAKKRPAKKAVKRKTARKAVRKAKAKTARRRAKKD